MPIFSSTDQLYASLGEFVRDIAASPGLGPKLASADRTVRLAISDPEAAITVGPGGADAVQVDFGTSSLEPDLILSMSGDDAHQMFIGNLDLMGAIASGRIGATGQAPELLPAWAAIQFAALPRYAASAG